MKTIKRIFSVITGLILGLILAAFINGCSTLAIIPTLVPPFMDTLIEGETPHIDILGKKVTVQGVVDARMAYHDALYPVVSEFYSKGRAVSQNVSATILGLLSAAGLAGTGALPLALKSIPKNAISKEASDEKVKAAGVMHPDDFKKHG